MYADELQIYHSRPREMLFECIRGVNSDLSKVFELSFANSLKLNLGPLPALFFGDDFIPCAFKAKNLDLTFSYNLNWSDHVSTICRKVYEALAGLRRLADFTFFAVRMRLVVALVIPFFIHCDCVSFALDFYSLRKLTVAFNANVRYNIFDSILGCFLLTYVEFWLACFMFSLLTGGRPRYLYDSLVFLRSERTLRINSPLRLDLYWPVKSGFKTRSQSQLGLCH
jgi:hypothetical protein